MQGFSVKIESYIREKQEGKGLEFCAASWLDSASKRAPQISVATHVLKYLHSDAKGTNIYVVLGSKPFDPLSRYVSTDTLLKAREDVVGNAAAMDIAGLLHLEVNGVTFLDLIAKDDTSLLAPFADSETRLLSWMKGFKSILSDPELSSHTLAKQIYFPTGEGKYHLLAPLYASSLSHVLYERVKEDRFGEKAKEAREHRKKEEYSDSVVVFYPDLAVQTFGGTKPQNISRLNSLRGGKSYLLRSAPPVWISIEKPPMKKNVFWKGYEWKAAPVLKEFKHFLLTVRDRDSNKDIRTEVQSYLDQLLDWLLLAAAEVQAMQPGWSKTSELPLHEQFWLDPHREDFKEIGCEAEWKEVVAAHFATWLIRKIEDKDLQFSNVNYEYFSDECLKVLKRIE